MAQALKSTGAETVRWNLSDLFASPDDPKIEATLTREMQRAKDFEARYKGKVATLEPKAFAAMMRELEDYEKAAAKPEVYAYMLHSGDTQDHAAGRLLARVREAGAERSSHMVFFYLELAQISDEQAAKLFVLSRREVDDIFVGHRFLQLNRLTTLSNGGTPVKISVVVY